MAIYEKKFSREDKQALHFLVSQILEKPTAMLSEEFQRNPVKAEQGWEMINALLFKDHPSYYTLDPSDRPVTDFPKLLLAFHKFLAPIWRQIRGHLWDLKVELATPVPIRGLEEPSTSVTGTEMLSLEDFAQFDSPSLYSKMGEPLIISLKTPATVDGFPPRFSSATLFLTDKIKFADRVDLVGAFLDLLEGMPVSYFDFCPYCGKCFVLVRNDKAYCSQLCAAKAIQKRRWETEPDRCKEKERHRYYEKRKKRDRSV